MAMDRQSCITAMCISCTVITVVIVVLFLVIVVHAIMAAERHSDEDSDREGYDCWVNNATFNWKYDQVCGMF